MKRANATSFNDGLPDGHRWSHPILLMAVVVSEPRQCRVLVAGPSHAVSKSTICSNGLNSRQKNYINQGRGGVNRAHL